MSQRNMALYNKTDYYTESVSIVLFIIVRTDSN